MNELKWKDIAEFLGMVAIVSSLVFVGLQLKQDQQIAVAQIVVETDSAAIELSQLLSENRDTWINGLEGTELTPETRVLFRALAWAVEQRHTGTYRRMRALDVGRPSVIAQNYAFHLYQYPGLRQAFFDFEMNSDIRDQAFRREDFVGFRDAVREALEKLDTESPKLPEKNYLPL